MSKMIKGLAIAAFGAVALYQFGSGAEEQQHEEFMKQKQAEQSTILKSAGFSVLSEPRVINDGACYVMRRETNNALYYGCLRGAYLDAQKIKADIYRGEGMLAPDNLLPNDPDVPPHSVLAPPQP